MTSTLGFQLYAVTDALLCGRDFLGSVREAIENGAGAVQLRDKGASALALYRIAETLRRLTRELRVPLIVNDRIDVALAVEADGVHLGQSDIPVLQARAIWPAPAILGISAATPELARLAQAGGADYVGAGPAFLSGTKPGGRQPLGPQGLKRIAEAVTIPVVAIGGITAGNAAEIASSGVAAVAAIAGLFGDPRGPGAAAAAILAAFTEGRRDR